MGGSFVTTPTSRKGRSRCGSFTSDSETPRSARKCAKELAESEKKRWEYRKENGDKVVLSEILEKVLTWVKKFEGVVDAAVSYDASGHAALPWAVVKVLISSGYNSIEMMGDMADGVEHTSKMIALYTEVEINSLRGVSRLKTMLANALVDLYVCILKDLSKARRYFSKSTFRRAANGVLQSSKAIATPLLDNMKTAAQEVVKIKDQVEAEDQKMLMTGVQSGVDKMLRDGIPSRVSDEDRRSQINKWLNAIMTNKKYQDAQSLREKNTCNWVLENKQYLKWIEPPQATDKKAKSFWLHGGPGFGKTIIAASVIDHLSTTTTGPIAYFFCVSEDESKREPYAILRSWILQLALHNLLALNIVYKYFKDDSRSSPGQSDLWNMFSNLIKSKRYIFVIDGYDECTAINKTSKYHTDDGRSQFLQKLWEACRNTQSIFLIVSRDHEDIRTPLTAAKKNSSIELFEHGITSDDTRRDISAFSAAVVRNKLPNKSETLQTELAEQAAERSDGLFLWVHLLRDKLDPGDNAQALKDVITLMPDRIDEAYERDVDRLLAMTGTEREHALAILRWVSFAVRPLTVRELAEALVLNSKSAINRYPSSELPDAWAHGYVDDDYVNSKIRRCCGSLIELRSRSEDEELALHTIHFVHFSAKEYLLRPTNQNTSQPKLQLICFPDGATEYNCLVRLCLRYLCYDVFGEYGRSGGRIRRRIRVYPFLEYAAKSWYAHAFREQHISQDLLHYAEKLFNPATSNWRIWSEVFESEESVRDDSEDADLQVEAGDGDAEESYTVSSPAHDQSHNASEEFEEERASLDSFETPSGYLAQPEESEVAVFENLSASPDDREKHADVSQLSPIYYAALLGLTELIKVLQDQGLECNVSGGHYGDPLQAAVAQRHQKTAEYLLSQTVDVRRSGGMYGSAIGAAVATGSDTLTKSLIKAGADLSTIDNDGRSLLHVASYDGNATFIQTLLGFKECTELIEKRSKLGETPVIEAAQSGNLAAVKLLTNAGADINVTTTTGSTALIEGLFKGSDDIVKELLRKQVDISKKRFDGATALHVAARHSSPKSVRYLLQCKADVHAKDDDGFTPLHCVAFADGDRAKITKLLLDFGAHQDQPTHLGYTALHIGAELGHEDIVEYLIKRGSGVNMVNAAEQSSLHIAVQHSQVEIVRILLSHGADPSLVTIEGKTALDLVGGDNVIAITELLLNSDALQDMADIPKVSRDAATAEKLQLLTRSIQVEIFRGNEERAIQLLSENASQDISTALNSTLLAAAHFGSESMVAELLRRGASYRSKTSSNRTGPHIAALRNHVPLMEAFSARGANIYVKGSRGSEPLDLACTRGLANLEAVNYLLERSALTKQIDGLSDNGDINISQSGTAYLATIKRLAEGRWSGRYTCAHWMKGREDLTAMTIKFVPESTESPPTFAIEESDMVGDFKIIGHVLPGNIIRFVKLYKEIGWLYSGKLDVGSCKIRGSWGTNSILWHGSFELQKDGTAPDIQIK